METNTFDKKERAKKRIAELKGFYIHLLVYIIVNTMIVVTTIVANVNNGESLNDAFWNFGTFITPFFWGIGLFFHGMKVFSINPFFSKDWEEQQIKKYMDQDRTDIEKFR